MRAVVIGILALFCGGCAAPAFDLVSRDPETPWLAGQRWVRTEASQATVKASYDRTWLDHLIFEVEVVNQSDAPLVVDPGQFSFTLASSGGDMPRGLRKRFSAEDPAKVRARLDRAASGELSLGETFLGFAALVTVVALAVSSAAFDPPPVGEAEYRGITGDRDPDEGATGRAEVMEFRRECERSVHELLQRTELAPGASARGEVWLPAAPLRRAVGGEPSPPDAGSITATPARAPSDYALTLRTPAALGGQEIEYSVAAW